MSPPNPYQVRVYDLRAEYSFHTEEEAKDFAQEIQKLHDNLGFKGKPSIIIEVVWETTVLSSTVRGI